MGHPALNTIDVEFYGKKQKSKDVVSAWEKYLSNLVDNKLNQSAFETWLSAGNELFFDLLLKMAICLNYDFNVTSLKNTSYFPVGYGQADEDYLIIRRELAKILSDKKAFPIIAVPLETDEAKALRKMFEDYLQARVHLKVEIVDKERPLSAKVEPVD